MFKLRSLIGKLLPALPLSYFIATPIHADTFGSGVNTFNIDFVNIGNSGNPDDTVAPINLPLELRFGGVPYSYRIGITEVPQDWFVRATASGMQNLPGGILNDRRPARGYNWYQ